ncbi:MAG: hypothetical protein QOK37_4324 [Thermoanaerobaculia bacterium]|jgi:hypothetical protein|nr:hypothetical protein [Thermoanaerobaculia bacterium]
MHRLIMATEDRHEKLKRRAAAEGRSLSELLLRESERAAPRISQKELLERLKSRARIDIGMSGAELVRADEKSGCSIDELFDDLQNRR